MIPQLKLGALALALSLSFHAFGDFEGYSSTVLAPEAGQPGVLEFEGEYIVPAPIALQSVASFKTNYCLSKDTDGKQVLAYNLPEEIVGKDKPRVALKETSRGNGFVNFLGEHGSASCRRTSRDMTCFVLYPGFDTTGSHEVVRERYADSPELQARLDLATVFSADPKGIVRFTMK